MRLFLKLSALLLFFCHFACNFSPECNDLVPIHTEIPVNYAFPVPNVQIGDTIKLIIDISDTVENLAGLDSIDLKQIKFNYLLKLREYSTSNSGRTRNTEASAQFEKLALDSDKFVPFDHRSIPTNLINEKFIVLIYVIAINPGTYSISLEPSVSILNRFIGNCQQNIRIDMISEENQNLSVLSEIEGFKLDESDINHKAFVAFKVL